MMGQTLGHYRIQEQVGAGGMGVVYRARDERLDRDVALKVLPPEALSEESARVRLLQEARIASALNHPHICTIYEVGEADGQTYIAMEYVQGRPLSAMIPRHGLPLETAMRHATQIADALAHAHDRGVIHHDLKSSNVVVTPEGRAKVLDFGLARRLRQEELSEATRSQVSVAEGRAIVGTLHYMAPEVLRGESADTHSDLWAFGVVLYEMAAGARPFQGQTGYELSSAILREPPAPLPERVPAGLRAIIQRCLAKEPGQRYQRAGEVRAALEAIQSGIAVVPAAPTSEVSRRRWLWALGGGAGLGMLALVVGLTPKGPRPAAGGPRLSTGAPASKNSEANEYFEKAILFFRVQNDQPRARLMLEKAFQLDPHFAEARRWYGFSYVIMINSGYSNDTSLLYKAEEELRRALQDDPASGSVHSALASVYMHQGRKDLVPIEVEKALKAKADDPEALMWLLNYHRFNGDNGAALTLARQMVEREPLFFPPRMNLGDILRTQGDTAGAIREQEKVLEQASGNLFGIWFLSRAYLDAGELVKARAILERGRSVDPKNYLVRLAWALLLALEGKREEAMKEMDEEVLKFASANFIATLGAAEFYASLGEASKALEWLERAVRNGDEREEWFRRDPLLASIRNEPRFQQILDSIAFRRRQRVKP